MTTTSIRARISNFTILHWLLFASVIILVASAILWWQVVYMSPRNVFNGMLKNNFATSGFTRQTESDENGLKAKEIGQIQTGGNATVQTRTELNQNGDKVITDAIGTTTQDFVRYSKIDTSHKDANGKPIDFSKAVNVWSKTDTGAPGQAFSQMLLGIVPIGNVSPETRKKLADFTSKHTVFSVDYKSVKTESVNGRKAYTYEVQLLPQTYVEMLKIYGQGIGLSDQVKDLDPKNYVDSEPTDLKLTIDARSRNLVKLSYVGSDRSEKYSGHGIIKDVKLPTKTIPGQELQERLSIQ